MGRPALFGRPGRRVPLWPGALAVLFTGACAAGGRPLPVPLPIPDGGGLPAREVLLEIGRKQPYDPNPGASDRAIVKDGIELTIEPQDGAYRQSESRLRQGAIVAEMRNHSQKPVPGFALEPGGRSFWVVYRKGSSWFSAFIADSKDSKMDRFDVPTTIHVPTRAWRQSIAQWQLGGILERTRPGDGTVLATELQPWVTCMELGCCRPGI